MLDGNLAALNQYEHNQTILEQQWELTMKEKQEAVVELAIKLLKQETTPELFNWVFSSYLDDSEDTFEHFYNSLECLTSGACGDYYSESTIIQVALEGACQSLYDCELDEITPHGLCRAVLEGLK